MSYKLLFHKQALKEWEKLDKGIREQFKAKLGERLENPKVPKDRLKAMENVYKIKLRSSGFRLVYEVSDEAITVLVLAVGKREGSIVYKRASKREG